uniref:Apple domain-containing protein n=1 Tax=Plectus sambesii TaxID=2011161 RepID=A0A914WM17_9BILA
MPSLCLYTSLLILLVFGAGISSDYSYKREGWNQYDGRISYANLEQNLEVSECMAQAFSVGQLAFTCIESNWSTWSARMQTCNNGRSNYIETGYNSAACNSSSLFECESCHNDANCSVEQLGSELLSSTSAHALVVLQYTTAGMEWILDGQRYPNLDASINDSSDYSLSMTACPLCMKTDHIYSSYEARAGKKLIESQSPEQVTVEFDAHACGARCSRINSCLGFSYNSQDQSCIPAKASLRTGVGMEEYHIFDIADDENWTFYDRI